MANSSRTTYSHPATRQDEWVLDSEFKIPATYIEVGAFDGKHHSNTLALENCGWSGLLIEGNPDCIDALIHNRGPHQSVHAVVASRRTTARFIQGGQYSGLERCMPNDWLEEHIRRKNKTIQVKTETLGDIYRERFMPKFGSEIGYLSLDTEGGEDSILKSFTGHLAKVHLMTIEFRYNTTYLARLETLVAATHRLVEVRGFDACFARLDHAGAQ